MLCMLCFSEMEPEWTYLHCRTCLFRTCQVPPPKATKIGPHIPGRPQLPGNDEDTSTEGEEDNTDQTLEELRRLAPEDNVDEFMLWVDGSGGENEWGVGMLDARDEKTQQWAGRKRYLEALQAMEAKWNYCDGHIAECLGLYLALRYAQDMAQTTTGGGIIVCDRTAALKNLIDKPLKDPVQQMVFELTKHAMVKALDRHSYITFVHKKVYGYKKLGS